MLIDTIKYNPPNITPDHLFCPPTSCTHGELDYLVRQLGRALEGEGLPTSRRLLVGTELEIFFFSPGADPAEAPSGLWGSNPNYSIGHKSKTTNLIGFAKQLWEVRPSEFLEASAIGRVGIEFRTAPQSVDQHLETMSRFGDLLRAECRKQIVSPVVHSQHLHISLREEPSVCVSAENKGAVKGIIPAENIVRATFSRITPMMLLPEEWGIGRLMNPVYIKTKVLTNGGIGRLDHPEFRLLSSEYACDLLLNLAVSLRAMYYGFVDPSASLPNVKNDKIGFEGAVRRMAKDEELRSFFGESTLTKLCNIIRQYPDVSRRAITVDQVKTI